MKTAQVALVAGCVASLALFGNCSSRHPYSQASALLSSAAEDYGQVASAVSSLNGSQPIAGKEKEQLTGLVSALSLNYIAKDIAEVRLKYLAAGDEVHLSAEEHSALLS